MAEAIEMQFRMLTLVSPGNMYYMGMKTISREWALLRCLAEWKAL